MARNHVVSGNLVLANIVPAISEVWWRQALHWNSSRPWCSTVQCAVPAQRGHVKPLGQRAAFTAAAHCSCVPKRRRTSGNDIPRWNWMRSIGMAGTPVLIVPSA